MFNPFRNPRPSRAVAVSAPSAGVLTPLIVWALSLAGVDVPAEVAAAAGPLLMALIAWASRGGRKGEAD